MPARIITIELATKAKNITLIAAIINARAAAFASARNPTSANAQSPIVRDQRTVKTRRAVGENSSFEAGSIAQM